jgi:hypothetical protein
MKISLETELSPGLMTGAIFMADNLLFTAVKI